MKINDLISESEVQQLDELKAGKYAQVASLLGALAAQHGGKAADAATVGWKQQAPHALATLATYADPKKLGALPATLSSDELNKGEDEWKRQRDKLKIGRLIPSLKEGVVSRRGNIVEIGSLKLHLYPDHIFYIVNGGKDADLSIYKDGAFKPPRNEEIYLKDAARYGVPQAFINLFAKFFADPDVDIIVQGLESLFKSHVKENKMKMEDLVSEDEKRMSRAGKGVMKYGKDGMKALAKAGRDGASDEKLDKLRDKYDKYDESVLDEMPGPYNMRNASRNRNVQMKDKMKDRGTPKAYRQPGEPSKSDLSAMAAKAKADYDKKKGLKEGDEPDHEASMAKGQLYNACKNAMELFKMIEDGENLEGWVAAKITKAADYLNSVHDYLVYEKKSMSEGGMPSSVIKHKQDIAALSPEEKKKKFAGKSIRTLKQMSWRHGYGPDSNEYAKYHDGVTTDDVKEEKQRLDPKCWTGYRKDGTKMKGGVRVNNCVKVKK